MSGIPLDYIAFLLDISPVIFQLISKYREKKAIKKELLEVIEQPLNKTKKSYKALLNSYNLLMGSIMLYYLVEPENPDEEAKRIADKFERNYIQFIRDLRNLTKTLKLCENETDKIFSPEDRFSIKHIILSFDRKKPDWDAILNDKKIMKLYNKQIKNKEFHPFLKTRIEEFTNKYQIHTRVDVLLTIMSNSDFQQDLLDLIDSYIPKE